MHKAVLVCTLAVVAALAAVGAPSPFLEVLGFQSCGGTFAFDGKVDPNVQTAGAASIQEAGRDGIKAKLEAGIKALRGNPKNKNTAQNITDTVDDVFNLNLDAVTMYERQWSWAVKRRNDKTISLLTVTWKSLVVTVLPANASDQLKAHETGHVTIEEKLKDEAGAKFKAEAGKIVDQVKTNAEIAAILDPVAAKLMKIGDDAQKGYDNTTGNGKNGGDQAAAAAAAFAAALAANP